MKRLAVRDRVHPEPLTQTFGAVLRSVDRPGLDDDALLIRRTRVQLVGRMGATTFFRAP
jgi:hypothetical protein